MEERFSGWRVAVACVLLVTVILGSTASVSVLMAGMAQEWDLTGTQLGLFGPVAAVSRIIFSFIVAMIVRKLKLKIWLLLGLAMVVIHHLTFFVARSVEWAYVAQFMSGFVFAVAGVPLITAVISNWFLKHRGLLIGAVGAGVGIGGVMYSRIAAVVSVSYGWRSTALCFAAIQLVFGLIAIFFIIDKPQTVGQKQLGWDEAEKYAPKASDGSLVNDEIRIETNASFWMVFLGVFMFSGALVAMQLTLPTHWAQGTGNLASAGNYNMIMVGTSVIAAIVIGIIRDKAGKTFASLLYVVAFSISMIMQFNMANSGNWVASILVPAVILFGCAFPVATIMPGTYADDYGAINFAKTALFLQISRGAGSTVLPILLGRISDVASNSTAYLASVVISIIGFVFLWLGYKISPVAKAKRAMRNLETAKNS